jgi:hypothetical protein
MNAQGSVSGRLAGLTALLSASFGGWLAFHHPLSPAIAIAACGLAAAAAFLWPVRWPAWLLGLFPVAGLAPWTGWIVVEEFDLLVLGIVSGGYLRLARFPDQAPGPPGGGLFPWAIAPFLISTLVSMVCGVLDAGGLSFGWWQGYSEPLNSVRLAKSIFLVLLLMPLWRMACRIDRSRANESLTLGMIIMLAVVSLVVLWERLAFTGLLNFSTDYRATGPFWEMHVGGAALDAVLALSLPFVVLAFVRSRSAGRSLATAALLALGAYACLATFSRIVYAAIPVSLGLAWWLQSRTHEGSPHSRRGALALAYLPGALLVFSAAGYRGLLALLGAIFLAIPLIHVLGGFRQTLRPANASQRIGHSLRACLFAAVLGLTLVWTIGVWVPKGTYWVYALAWVSTGTALTIVMSRERGPTGAGLCLGLFIAVLVAMIQLSVRWAGGAALASCVAVALALLAATLVCASRSSVVDNAAFDWHRNGQQVAVLALISAVVGVFLGGSYMGTRVNDVVRDGADRSSHWAHALRILDSPTEWVFGKGLGRYHAHHVFSGKPEDQTGDYRLITSRAGQGLVLTSGKHPIGSGQLFRFSQRIRAPAGGDRAPPEPLVLHFDLLRRGAVDIRAEVCEKHLLYWAACLESLLILGETDASGWETVEMRLTGKQRFESFPYVPKPQVFSIGLSSPGKRVEIDNLHLVDVQGRELLKNGDFEDGLARWFFSSDRHHLPWHAKNQAVHLLVEQGLLGLLAFLWFARLVGKNLVKSAHGGDSLAPVMSAALVGLLTVGLVDSVFDMPRVTFLTLFLMAVAHRIGPDGEHRN